MKEQRLILGVEAFMMVIALSITIGALQYDGNQRSAAMVIGVPTIVMLALLMIAEAAPGLSRFTKAFGVSDDDEPNAQASAGAMNAGTWRRVGIVYLWLVAYFVATFILGHYIATPLFMAAFFAQESGLSPRKAVAVSAASSAILYGLFEILLDIPLWTGVLPRIVPDLIGGGRIPPLN